ncbi:MAG: DUF1385 domain-containing protein [Eubacteriales bacterium]|nr:DUF1385 domain-containing protein [Eubacteriales bacterium]
MSSEKVLHKTSIGGQAVLEGIMMKGPRKTCIAVRKPDGEIVTEESENHPLKERYPIVGLPIIRGFVNMISMMAEGFHAIDYSSRFLEEEDENYEPGKFEAWLEKKIGAKKIESAIFTISIVLGVLLAVGLFILLPAFLSGLLSDRVPHLVENLIEGVIRIVLFVFYMWLVSLMKDIRRTYEYHGAEHKTIYCYEKGLELTVENVRMQKREHPRCGTSFLFVIMIISILVFWLIDVRSRLLRMALRIVLLPLIIGLSYEVLKITGRSDGLLSRIVSWPGRMLQHLTVLEPDDSMIEVAITAMKAVIPEKQGEDAW